MIESSHKLTERLPRKLAFNGRESAFVGQYEQTHYTATQIARKYSMTRDMVIKRLPPPDIICPYGNKTRLWERGKIIKLLGDGEK